MRSLFQKYVLLPLAGILTGIIPPLSAQNNARQPDTILLQSNGDQLFANLQGNFIVFQNNTNKKPSQIFYGTIENPTVLVIDTLNGKRHPVWVPGQNKIVYDTGQNFHSQLILYDISHKSQRLLLHRNIAAKEACFTPSRHLVVFSGFDDQTQHWQIFTYDFVYDNLNRLTTEQGNCSFPVFSPNGKKIVYTVFADNGRKLLKEMNWYGQHPITLATGVSGRVGWTPDNWRILFVRPDNPGFGLFSITTEGTGLQKICTFPYPVCCPVFSKDGKYLWLSVKRWEHYQLERFLFVQMQRFTDTPVK